MNHIRPSRTVSRFAYVTFALAVFCAVSGLTTSISVANATGTNPPTITLTGASSLALTVGDTFTDPGYTTADADGDVVTVTTATVPGPVDTSTAGTFTITYTATDSTGLTALTTRTVTVAAASTSTSSSGSGSSGPLTIIATAITCPTEADLPNWGDKGPAMTSATVSTYLTAHPACHTVSGWGFQWGFGGKVTDPGPAYIGAVPPTPDPLDGWNSFGPTDTSGVATVSIPDLHAFTDVWVREQLPAGYIPFSEPPFRGSGDKNNFSAEVYCASDVVNYDNYDAVYGAHLNTTYYCATFNTPASGGAVSTTTSTTATNTPPVITITGSNPVSIAVNTAYTDLGATATDTEDGNITSHIVTSGTVSTTTVGTYAITYSVTDSGGLSASSTRTVNVTAAAVATNTPPVITILGDNPATINVGTVYTDAGASSTDAQDGDITSHIIASSTVATTTVGTYTVTYTVTDSGGLTATSTRTVNVVDPTVTTTGCSVNCGGGGSGPNISFGGGGGGGGSGPLLAAVTSGSINTSLTCPLLRDYLRYGANNDPTEVVKLQAFLQRTEGYDVDITGTFDQKTLAGVHAFQTKYLTQVMGPWGATRSSGYVYITTKKKINEIACATAFIISPSEQAIIDAYKAAQNGTENFGPGTSTTSPDVGFNATSSPNSNVASIDAFNTAGTANTAGAANTSVFGNFWAFLKSLFGFD